VVVGRDLRADLRVAHPLVSRAHLLLRFEQGRWLAIDNGSSNGTYVNGHRVPVVDIHDGQILNIGNPEGPQLTFEVGLHAGTVGRPPQTATTRIVQPSPAPRLPQPQPARPGAAPPAGRPRPPGSGPARPHPGVPPAPPQPAPPNGQPPTHIAGPGSAPPSNFQPRTQLAPPASRPPQVGNTATRIIQAIRPRSSTPEKPPGSTTIGRASDNDIVIPDVLASRYHAYLVQSPLGTEIREARGTAGTFLFVNGVRVGAAVLNEGDVVTIGNVDLVFTHGNLVRCTEAATCTGGLEVNGVHFKVHNKELLDNISLNCAPGTLTAIIGGSGAGKTTLSRLIAGYTRPSLGSVTFEGHDIHAEYAVLRSRIGMVPQDDVVHRQLTVNQALGYAAELRLPPDTSKEEHAHVVAEVLEELDLTKHADTRVDKLSGGQRKRASVALELLTQPSLLLLDEPTSGLDPALDRQVMLMLRQLADAGRVVVVVTHSLTYLDFCDHVLLLAPGGKTAFNGPPDQVEAAMGTRNWADIFTNVGDDPDAANQRFLAQNRPRPLAAHTAEKAAELGPSVRISRWRQFSTIARRQVRLIVSDRVYFAFLALLPFVMGALALTVRSIPGTSGKGFDVAPLMSVAPTQPAQILALLNVGAVFMGIALTIRDLIGERPIFLREQAVGMSTGAYLMAKIVVFGVFAIVQSAIMTTIVVLGKGAPTKGAVLLGSSELDASIELFVGVAATCVISSLLGLLLSALARSNEQIMPLLVVSIMSQLVLAGGMIPVTGRKLDPVSWVTPARWGYAAEASTVDLRGLISPNLVAQDSHWQHTPGVWLVDIGMLAVLFVVYAAVLRWEVRLKR
jgi:ABC transport system ATP-binding/permease protein